MQAQAQVQHEVDENTSAKKPRVVWSVEMHQQFVNAVNSLGIDSKHLFLSRTKRPSLQPTSSQTSQAFAIGLASYYLQSYKVSAVHPDCQTAVVYVL